MRGQSIKFGVGWLKQSQNGSEYISAVAGGQKNTVKLILQDEAGNQQEVENFAVFFNQDKKTPKAPDVSFVFTPKS
jgi:uncharacterized protein (DUF736 family)